MPHDAGLVFAATSAMFIIGVAASDCLMPALTAKQFSALPLDYIVIGSGAGGMTVATRLSQDSSVSVGLVEAGVFHKDDPLIDVPAFGGRIFGNASYDWLFATIPQDHAAGRIIQETRGKMLGGSTGINLLAWDRASKTEYDAWQLFADDSDWNFDNLLPYFIKSETIDLKNNDVFPGVSQMGGPIHASYNSIYGDLALPLASTWNNLGVRTNPNTIGGHSSGVRNERTAVVNGVRSYSASAYYCPASKRRNLHVLTGAQASKILFREPIRDGGDLQATDVLFISNGITYKAHASKEVILAAGTVQTPQLLELSGIGDEAILSTLGIKTLINLPGVGANLQDHIYTVSQWVTLPNITTFDMLRYNETFVEEQTILYEKTRTGFLNTRDSNVVFLNSNDSVFSTAEVRGLIKDLEASLSGAGLTPLQRAQFEIQLKWLHDGSVPQAELIAKSTGLINPANNTKYLSILSGLMHPLSRGTIHINSTNPLEHPVIDPKYLSFDYDLHSLSSFTSIGVEVAKHQPIASLLVEQQFPPPDTVEGLENYVTSSFLTGDHLTGTAAMAAKDLGGVVDANLRVYGVSNLRIVDASIMPMIVGAHLQSTVYAIAEKAADIIRSQR
ncbi:alcohol oxidase [Mycena crocata]|nr:alcohol oxidase [Mycena crocata]